MKYLLILCCLLASALNGKNLNQDCKTTIVITDCSDQPVVGATVRITKCSDGKALGTITDARGRASFAVCKSDICKSNVTIVGYTKKSARGIGDDCSGNDQKSTCKLMICDKGN